MKGFTKFICLITVPLIIMSCGDHTNSPTNVNAVSVDQSDNLKVGGLYLIKKADSTYYITKVLALDDFAVHLRTYKDTFRTKPTNISSENLKVMIGHAPIDKTGFLLDHPELLKVENVKESELEGYKMYLKEMSK